MLNVFEWNNLIVQKVTSGSIILDGGSEGRVIMPRRYAAETVEAHEELRVFVYRDSTGCLAATTETPLAQADTFAFLKAIAADRDGVYLDWGIGAPLFLAHQENRDPREMGKHYLVKLIVDADGELEARADLLNTLEEDGHIFERGQEVELLIGYPSPLGYKCIINNTHRGILYDNQVFETLHTGEIRVGYVEKVREDGKLDLSLRKPGYDDNSMDKNAKKILNALQAAGGELPFHDKSDPDAIREHFGMSKKLFKQSIGRLYKERQIELLPEGIRATV